METKMANTKDNGRIRVGAGCRIAKGTVTKDSGKIRMGAGCRITRSK
jgi:hypothetical protein